MRILPPHNKMGYHSCIVGFGNTKCVEDSLDGCEDNLLGWRLERECLLVSIKRIWCEGSRT
jgi:hypothetical protein